MSLISRILWGRGTAQAGARQAAARAAPFFSSGVGTGQGLRKGFSGPMGKRSVVSDLAIGAGIAGAGLVGGALMQNRGDLARSYYGDQEYQNKFRGYFETSASVIRGAGIGFGAARAMGFSFMRTAQKYGKGVRNYSVGRKIAKKYSETSQRDWPIFKRRPNDAFFERKRAIAKRITTKNNPFFMAPARLAIGGGLLAGTATAVLGNPVGALGITAATTAAGLAPLALRHIRPVSIGAAAFTAGAAAGYGRSAHTAAEGSIESFDYNSSGVMSRLNYSTAGLTQALHNNRKG